jgi:hypothetical protein
MWRKVNSVGMSTSLIVVDDFLDHPLELRAAA